VKTIILIITFLFFSAPLWAVDLTEATLQELVTERPDLVQDIKSGKDEGTTVVSVVKDAQDRMSVWTEVRRDINDNLLSKRKNSYTYYSTDSVNEIIQERYEGTELTLVSKQKVKHYRDGTQPDVIPLSIEIPKKL
jgi:hypothetical protein